MNGYRISEAARITGFTVTALRYYEKEGLILPARDESGYREYTDDDIEALRFVSRAKHLGLSLDEITELLDLLGQEDCGRVQSRMRQLVTTRIGEAQQQIAELVAFTAQLQRASSRLDAHAVEGACDDGCACWSESSGAHLETAVPLVGTAHPDVSCTLEPERVEERTGDWNEVAHQARGHEALPTGIRLRFTRNVDVAALAALAADEQACCDFFSFSIGVRSGEVTLDVTGPDEVQPVIQAMFGVPA
ncbi:MAG: MerR family transcriptional regulator [Actinomycetota bacterium]